MGPLLTSTLLRAAVDAKAGDKLVSKYITGEMADMNPQGMLRGTLTYHDLRISSQDWEIVRLLLLNRAGKELTYIRKNFNSPAVLKKKVELSSLLSEYVCGAH